MSELAADVISVKAISQRERSNDGQGPTNCAARHFQDDDNQRARDPILRGAFKVAVLIAEGALVSRDVDATRDANDRQDQTTHLCKAAFGDEDQDPRQGQRHVQRARDEIRDQTGKDQPKVKCDGDRAEDGPNNVC